MAEYKSVADEIEAMLNNQHETEDSGSDNQDENFEKEFDEDFEENQDEGLDVNDDLDNGEEEGDDNSAEDTDVRNDEDGENENESETNENGDDQSNDTGDNSDESNSEDDEENSQEESEDNSNEETKDENGDSDNDTSTTAIDAEEYKKLKAFYDKVTGEFSANGKKIKGFNDPDKIIQGLQKAIGFEAKNAVINQHKKFLAPLKEKGFLDNPEKFNLAMSIMDGDKEAIKEHLKSLEINPVLDLDLDDIKYDRKDYRASDGKVILDEAFNDAESYGVKDKLSDVLANELDDNSFKDFLQFPKLREDLLTHLQDGTYDLVKERMNDIRTTDMSGEYKSLKVVDQYRYALNQLAEEYAENASKAQIQNAAKSKSEDDAKALIKNRADNIMSQAVVLDDEAKKKIAAEEEAKFREETRRRLEADAARKEAASVSKTKTSKTSSSAKKDEFDPLKLTGDDFKNYFEGLMR